MTLPYCVRSLWFYPHPSSLASPPPHLSSCFRQQNKSDPQVLMEVIQWTIGNDPSKQPPQDLLKIGHRQLNSPNHSHPVLPLTPSPPVYCFQIRCHFILIYFQNTAFEVLLGADQGAPLSFLCTCKLWHLLKMNGQECLLKIKDENSTQQLWGQRWTSKEAINARTNISRFWIASLSNQGMSGLFFFLSKPQGTQLWGDSIYPTNETREL